MSMQNAVNKFFPAQFSAVICDANHLRKTERPPKRAVLIRKLKIFIKAKLTVSKSCLLGFVPFMNFCILRGAPLQKVKYWKGPSYDF